MYKYIQIHVYMLLADQSSFGNCQSVPNSILETHDLCALRMDFQKECGRNTLLQSLSAMSKEANEEVELEHSLLLENGSVILRGRTTWRPRK